MNNNQEWLSHLQDSIPKEVYGYSTSMYSLALEGWRRGLTLKFINKNQVKSLTDFVLSNEKRRYRFSGSRGNIIPKDTINLCSNKHETKELLKQNNIPVLDGELFAHDVPNDKIIEYAETFGYPLVVKPFNGNSGEGVVVNIKNDTELKEALIYVRKKLQHTTIMIERYIPSVDYQLYIIDGEVVAAFERVAAYVIGDGERTINSLINRKNKSRRRNPGLYLHLIERDDKELEETLQSNGYTLESIPEKGEQVFLKTKTNVTEGGDPIDVTDELPDHIKEMAVKAAQTIPRLSLCAVEIIMNKDSKESYVLEVKTQPSISGHLFPAKGKAQDVAKRIIDFYFPESNIHHDKPLYYFDFEHVFRFFNTNGVQEYTIPSAPTGNLTTKRFNLKGITNRMDFIKWIQPQLLELGLNGFFKYRRKGRLTLVVSGSELSVQQVNGLISGDHTFKKEDFECIEKEWERPVKIGFEVHLLKERKAPKKKKRSKNKPTKTTKTVSSDEIEQTQPLGKFLESIKNIHANF